VALFLEVSMRKETFYFTHDYNARADRKLVNVIMKHGMAGVGVYWCLVEMLYEEGGYLPTEYERISFELRTDLNVIQSIINDSELFHTDLDKFWSDAVLERLQQRCEKSEKARESINKRWDKYKVDTNVIRTNDDRNTIKESKEEEIKIKENRAKKFAPPVISDVVSYFEENGYKRESGIKAYNYYNTANWRDSKGNQVRNWKQKMIAVWFKDENKINNTNSKKEYHASDF
jgi:hypothetical protein